MNTLPTPMYETITPGIAEELLKSNSHNRRLVARRVNLLAAEMTAGNWRPTHQGIAIGKDGVLLDGQHRLAAVVKSGIPVTMLVTWDADPEAFSVLDVGTPRSAADVLGISGVCDPNIVAATIRLLVAATSGEPRPWRDIKSALTAQAVDDLYRTEYQDLVPVVQTARRIRKRLAGSPTAFAAALYVINKWASEQGGDMPERAEEWTEGLCTGAGLCTGDARLALASWMSGSMRQLSFGHVSELLMMLTMRAWKAEVRGELRVRMIVRDPATYQCVL